MHSHLLQAVTSTPKPTDGGKKRDDGSPADQIVRRLTIESMLNAKAGTSIVCPLDDHADTDPSFRIHGGDKGWYCYGCTRGGSVIDFVMYRDAIDRKTAIHKLADSLGIQIGHDVQGTTIGGQEGTAEHPGTSWRPVDLDDALTGTLERPKATILRRSDGAGLMYPGRFNMLFGASESAKTWMAMVAEAQVLDAGGRVVHVDLESEQAEYVLRMRLLGASDDQLRDQVAYVYPDEALHRIVHGTTGATDRDLGAALDPAPTLIVFDAMGEMLNLHGLSFKDNDDLPKLTRFFRRLAGNTGAAVVAIDHIPKSNETGAAGPIGAQAKRSGVTGTSLSCKASQPLAPGKIGKVILRVDKDRVGSVRAVCPAATTPVAARITLDAATSTQHIAVTVDPPRGEGEASEALEARMADVASALTRLGGEDGLSKRKVREAITGKATLTDDALERLQATGHIEIRSGARGALVHALVRPYPTGEATTDAPL